MAGPDFEAYHAEATLNDGTEVLIRPIRPEDAPAVAASFEQFGPESRHQRFFSAKTALTDEELARLTHPENENALRLVAEIRAGPQAGRLIGGAGCVIDAEDPQRAEIAFSIIDAFQGKGLGPLLLRHLATLARANGIVQFVATVMPDNTPMLTVFERSGLPIESSEDRDAVCVTLSLA
ncbi:MAG TPA: GNAT family N-acetyltransferase [Pelomicrobium sp.]|nr:GNAT family N-acetyltransferase [Pelomicrobium sp.]